MSGLDIGLNSPHYLIHYIKGAFGLNIDDCISHRGTGFAEKRFYYLVNFVMTTYVNKQNLIFINELKNDPTIIIYTESPLSSQFTAEFVGS